MPCLRILWAALGWVPALTPEGRRCLARLFGQPVLPYGDDKAARLNIRTSAPNDPPANLFERLRRILLGHKLVSGQPLPRSGPVRPAGQHG